MSSTYKSKGKVEYPSYLKYNRKLKVQGLLTLKVKQLSGETRIRILPNPWDCALSQTLYDFSRCKPI